MLASSTRLASTGAQFRASAGRRGCVHLAHYSVDYCEWGEGPPLVLVPGLAGGYQLLEPLAQALAPHNRVISYRLRGEDDCFALRRQFDLSDLASDLAELLDALRLESPTLFGVSFGGVLALEFAARHPHRLQQLIVQGTGARFQHGLIHQVAGIVLSRFPLPTDSPFVNQFFNLLFGGKQKPGPLVEFVTRTVWSTDQSVMAHRFQLVKGFDIRSRLNRIRVPALVLHGERDVLVAPRSLEALCAGLPQCEQRVLEGCGHLAFVTQPQKVAEAVQRFLVSASMGLQ